MTTVYLILGSNEGDRLGHLRAAAEKIASLVGPVQRMSAVYVTAAWGNTGQPDFYNQVLEIKTALPPAELLATTLAIEKELGRVRGEVRYEQRRIDIDILFYGDQVVEEPELEIPHPRMSGRRFVLVPMAELAASLEHPGLHKTIAEMLAACDDELAVEKMQTNTSIK